MPWLRLKWLASRYSLSSIGIGSLILDRGIGHGQSGSAILRQVTSLLRVLALVLSLPGTMGPAAQSGSDMRWAGTSLVLLALVLSVCLGPAELRCRALRRALRGGRAAAAAAAAMPTISQYIKHIYTYINIYQTCIRYLSIISSLSILSIQVISIISMSIIFTELYQYQSFISIILNDISIY
jgi:hypothetical protein